MNIVVNYLSYVLHDGTSIFNHISFSITAKTKCAVVGTNGCGKSSLLNILHGTVIPTDGDVSMGDIPYLVPQHYGQYNNLTIGRILGVHDKLIALESILSGKPSDKDFEILGDRLTIEEDVRNVLDSWGLVNVRHDSPFGRLSGGEKTKEYRCIIHGLSLWMNQQIILTRNHEAISMIL